MADGTLSGRLAKEVFDEMFMSGYTAAVIVEERGLRQVSDAVEIEVLVDTVVLENANKVEEYKAGKDKLFGFFVGQVMKASQGKANPKVVNDILREKLG